MTLHQKTIVIIGLTLILLVGLLYCYSQVFFLNSFVVLEEQNMERDVQRALSALSNNISNLNAIACDYGWWDETVHFIYNHNPDYVDSSFTLSTFTKFRLNLILLIDNSGQVVMEKSYDLDQEVEIQVPDSVYQHLLQNKRMVMHADQESYLAGILRLPEGCMIVASRPILNSEGEGPVAGTIIIGRFLDQLEVQRLSLATHMSMKMFQVDDPLIQQELPQLESSFWDASTVDVQALDEVTISGYTLLRDIYGEPAMVLKVDSPRVIYQKGQESIHFFIIVLVLSGIVFGFVIVRLLKRVVLSRMDNLGSELARIGEAGVLQARVPVEGRDELAQLASRINDMLADLEDFQKSEARYVSLVNQLQTAHQQLTEIIDFLPDATFVIDSEKKVIAWNQAMVKMTGLTKEQMIGQGDYSYAIPFYGQPRSTLINLVGSEQGDIELKYEYLRRRGNNLSAEVFVPALYGGKGAFLMVTASPLYDSQGVQVGAIESIRDITDRKVADEREKFMSLHDSLTGLYNRTHFEQMMTELDKTEYTPVGIILCDVDGLKIVNDTLGHEVGDRMLLAAADLLRKTLGDHDIVARIGGDEFAIILPRRAESEIENTTNRLRDALERYNHTNPGLPLSMSFGYAMKQDENMPLSSIFKEADNNMYREKLHHNQSNRSAIVQTLMKALEARDFVTEEHAERLQNLVVAVGLALGMPEHKVTDLRLLARFHDIGKVGIPDRILFKKGPLSSEEYAEMKRHCEIGYRIAQTAPELVPIADGILKHHERWDGKGYPLGLTGEAIPMECRILALADTYDAMTSDRPYRKAMTKDKVITELRRCSGTQFDPNLVEKFIDILEQQEHLLINNQNHAAG